MRPVCIAAPAIALAMAFSAITPAHAQPGETPASQIAVGDAITEVIPELDGSLANGAIRPSSVNTQVINEAEYGASKSRLRGAALPAAYDLRSANPNAVTPVRDQGEYGSCWSFATAASAESSIARNGAVSTATQLSPAHIVYTVLDTGTF
ncbi:MAG: hypothetical protein LBQ92_05160, partial [Propionibacteriaceae bacterium]|nr:hypothetical protein [Propionibacteriaceae bacterium]